MPNHSRKCGLLELPAELRNSIYRFALVEGTIPVLSQAVLPTVPPLLSDNKQIRREATSIYFEDNTFRLEVNDFDASNVTKFCSAALVRQQKCVMIEAAIAEPGGGSWANLKTWLRAFYDQNSHGPITNKAGTGYDKILAAQQLFEVVARHRRTKPMPNWEDVVEPQLESVRVALAAVDASGVWT